MGRVGERQVGGEQPPVPVEGDAVGEGAAVTEVGGDDHALLPVGRHPDDAAVQHGADVEVPVGAEDDVVGHPEGGGVGFVGDAGDGAAGEVEVDDPVGQGLGHPDATPPV